VAYNATEFSDCALNSVLIVEFTDWSAPIVVSEQLNAGLSITRCSAFDSGFSAKCCESKGRRVLILEFGRLFS